MQKKLLPIWNLLLHLVQNRNLVFHLSGISLQDTSAEAREKQAKQLFAFAKENNISGLMQETDTSGRTSFGELDEGIYLLAQIGNVESGTDKFESAPFL